MKKNDNMFITLVTVILYAIQMLTPHCKCLNLVDLPNNEVYSNKTKFKDKEYIFDSISTAKVQVNYEPYPLEDPKAQRRNWFVDDPPNEKIKSNVLKRKDKVFKAGKRSSAKIPVNYEPYSLEEMAVLRRAWSANNETHSNKSKVKDEINSTGSIPTAKVPVKYEPYSFEDRKAQRKYWLSQGSPNEKGSPERKIRAYEDEKDANLKAKIAALVQQTLHDTERKFKYVQELKDRYRDEPPYRAGFIMNMIEKSKDVLDELFNVAVKHKEEWMAVEQLKIFELIVHTNVDTTNLLRQLVDIHVKYANISISDLHERKRLRI